MQYIKNIIVMFLGVFWLVFVVITIVFVLITGAFALPTKLLSWMIEELTKESKM